MHQSLKYHQIHEITTTRTPMQDAKKHAFDRFSKLFADRLICGHGLSAFSNLLVREAG